MLNKVMLIGCVMSKPAPQELENGSKFVNFVLGIIEKLKNKDGKELERMEQLDIACSGLQAELAEKCIQKGTLVYVEGRIHRWKEWEDEDKAKRCVTDIHCNILTILA